MVKTYTYKGKMVLQGEKRVVRQRVGQREYRRENPANDEQMYCTDPPSLSLMLRSVSCMHAHQENLI